MSRARPRFDGEQRRELRERQRLTVAQIEALERALPEVAACLQRSAPANEVRGRLTRIATLLNAAEAEVLELAGAQRPDAAHEAFGHLQMAGAQVGWSADAQEAGCLGYPVAVDAISLVAAIARRAVELAPKARRSPNRASALAVDAIVDALWRPDDEESLAVAAKLRVSQSPPSVRRPTFMRIAQIVFDAAARGSTGEADGDVLPSPDRSIRLYLAQVKKL